MPEIGLFCHPIETERIFGKILSETGLHSFKPIKDGSGYRLLPSLIKHPCSFEERHFCLENSREAFSATNLREMLCLWLPFVADNMLCMGTISAGIDRTLNAAGKGSSNKFRKIRSILERDLIKGVFGVNVRTGARHFYKDIFVTRRVAEGSREFKALKPFLCDTFVEFVVPGECYDGAGFAAPETPAVRSVAQPGSRAGGAHGPSPGHNGGQARRHAGKEGGEVDPTCV